MNWETLATAHLLPPLLNRLKKYQEALEWSSRIQRIEGFAFGKLSVAFLETKAELAFALYKLGDSQEPGNGQRGF